MKNDLDDAYVTVNGVSAPVSMYGNAFVFLTVLMVVVSLPYTLGDMYGQKEIFSEPFRSILTFYNFIIGIPLRIPTNYLYEEFDGVVCFALIAAYWILFYSIFIKLCLLVAKYTGKPLMLLLLVGPLACALVLMWLGEYKRPLSEVHEERAAISEANRRVKAVEAAASEARMKIIREEREVWGEVVDGLYIMGYQVIFPPEHNSFLSSWGARGELAINAYAVSNGLDGASREHIISKINDDLKAYLIPIQNCLKKHEYLKGEVSGVLNNETKSAVKLTAKKGMQEYLSGLPTKNYVNFIKQKHSDCAL